MSSKSSLSRSDSVGNAAGDSTCRAVAYYNYHSLPVPSTGIDSLLKFVTSQLSLTILSLFFCCDLRSTPPDVIDHVEKLTNCTILNISMNGEFDMEISKPLSHMAGHDPGKLIIISDDGNFEALINRLPGWQLVVFHSSDIDRNFFDYATRTIELPVINEPEPTFEKIEMKKWNSKPVTKLINPNLTGMVRDLAEVNKSLRKMLERLLVNNHKKFEQSTIKTVSYGQKENDVFSDEPVSQHDCQPTFRGNGWDDFPLPDASLRDQMGGWDEVEKEQPLRVDEPISPFLPFGQRNPFGSDTPSMPTPPASPYNQDLYDNRALFRVDNVCNGFAVKDPIFDKPKGRGFAKMLPDQEIHPQLVPHGAWNKESSKKNPFGGRGGAQKPSPTPRNGRQQCPQWEDPAHRLDTTCTMYHPVKPCLFFPNCRQPAADCPFAHPFCTGGDCQCAADERDLRLNHYNPSGKE